MKDKIVTSAFLQNLQVLASSNIKFQSFLNDIDLNNLSRSNEERIFVILSNAILEPQLTVHIADLFKNDILKILYALLSHEVAVWNYENHMRICLALSKIVNIHPDVGSFVLDYFEKFPAPFTQVDHESYPISKRSKIDTNNEHIISDLEIVNLSYTFLKFSPGYFRNKWPWHQFISRYIEYEDYMVRWICCQCIGIISAMNAHQLHAFCKKTLSEDEADKSLVNFEVNFNVNHSQEGRNLDIDIPTYISGHKSYTSNNIVTIAGINIPVYKKKIQAKMRIVEVESTKNNLRKIAMGVLSDKAINLVGPVGSGKSVLIEYIAERTGRVLGEDFIKIQLGDQTDSKMLLGTYRCTDIPGEFIWQPGVLTQAVMTGSWILLEDIDSASTDIASVLCSLLENKHLSVPGYRDAVPIKPGFCLFVTQRLISTITGYHKRRSHATDILEKHLLNINVEPLSDIELEKVITTLFPILKTICPRIVSVFKEFTKGRDENGSLHKSGRLISTRDLFKWCSRAIIDYDVSSNSSALKILQDAIDIFCCSQRDKESRLNLAKVISSHLGIVSENATYFCTQYKPYLNLSSDVLTVGRATIKRMNSLYKENVKFCFTRPSTCLLESIMCCVVGNEPVLLVGETGTGKTSTIQFLARTLGQELIVINMNQQSDSADLLGGFKPVDLKFIVGPIRKEFEKIFCSFFNVEKNKTFLSHIAYCFNSHLYNELVLLMKKSYEAAMNRLRTQDKKTLVGKKRKQEISTSNDCNIIQRKEFSEKWRDFGKNLEKLELQLKHKNALAFSFIEGSLVKAVENGQWVLLDEINLANAETLECLSSLLEGSQGSLNLLERGDKKPIRRHPNFTLFACMNPSTDVGKKDLPSGLRNRFTEFFVDELIDKNDLLMLANSYLEAKSLKGEKLENLMKFYLKVRKEAELNLADGLGHKPHFSLRSFCRALYIASKNPCGNIIRSLYEAFCLSFLTQLDLRSYNMVEKMITSFIVGSGQELKSILKHNIPKPRDSNLDHVQFEGYWVPSGTLEPSIPEDYILTKSVKKNLKDLVRIVSIGQLPVLLQGDTSVGKTSLITYLAKASGHKCVRINNHEHTDLQEYVGSYVADVNGKLIFREGLLVEAMKKGHWIILDELNLAPSDVLEALNRVLDDNRELFVPETQEVVKAHPNFMLFATQNPPGSYGGRKMLSRAFRNRFIELHFNEIPPDELETILHQRCRMAPSYAKKMINVMKELQMRRRGSAAFAGKHGFITLRDLFRWGERYRLAEDKSTLYDWDQHIADEGYLLLAGKVRKQDEKVEIADVIKKFMKRDVDPKSLFTLSDKTSPVTRPILENIEENQDKHPSIVWTFNMRQLAVLLSKAMQFHEPALLVGETGCGKTTVCDLIAQNNCQKLDTVNCHMHTESSDFIGGLRPVREHTGEDANKLFEWVDGPLIKAMVTGNVFLIDEISLADDSVLERLNSLLEPERTLLLAEKGIDINNVENSELIIAHDSFHFIGTMNPGGDFGKKELSPALRNRFTEIWCDPCNNKEDLIHIINHNIKSDLKSDAVNFGYLIMNFINWFQSDEIGKRFTISVRDILTWVNFINACSNIAELSDLYLNGACLTFLDSLGSGVTSSESDKFLTSFKEKCFAFIIDQLTKCGLNINASFGNDVCVEKKERLFGINPFYIEIGVGVYEDVSFSFDVPTIKDNALKLLRGLQLKKAILLEGSPGVGKTSLVMALARKTNNKIYRVNLSDQTDISDLFGADLPLEGGESGHFAWRDGPLLQALKKGHWILLDELNLASQSVLEGLNACLDHRGEIFIPELGKTFRVKQGTKFFACQNPLKQGGSRRGLPKSFLNRFTQVYISALTHKDYLRILKEQFPQIPIEVLVKMVGFNERLLEELNRSAFGRKGGPWEYNLRDLTRWCEIILYCYNTLVEDKQYAPESSVKLIYSNRLRTLDDKRKIEEIFEEVFNRKVSGELTTVYVTETRVYLGDCCFEREIDGCNFNVQKEEETCLVLRSQLKDLRSLAYCVNMNWMSIIVGNSGCGKTSLVRTLAHLAGKTLCTLPVTSAMDTSDLLGGFEQTDYTRHLDDIIKETELLILRAIQNYFLSTDHKQAVELLKQWENCSKFLTEVNENRTMTEETALFIKKLENLSNIWKALRDNETTSEDIKQTVVKLEGKGRVLFDAVKKEGTLSAGGKFEWVDSVLIKCLQNGHWLLIDNVNLCSPAVLDRLNALLEPNGTLTISERGVDEDGKMVEIKPHKNFRLFLTMDPKNGEISRAMRNRGVGISLTNDYHIRSNFDMKSLINLKGISENNLIELLLHMHNFICDLVIADKPNVESILQSAFLISQQLKRGIEMEEAITSTIVDVYYKSRSDYDFNSNDPLSVIKNEIRRNLNEDINKMSDIVKAYDSSITLQCRDLDLNTDLTKIKQQMATLRKYCQQTQQQQSHTILYYFMAHFYSVSSTDDLRLRYIYLSKMVASQKYPEIIHTINELLYKLFASISCGTTQLPVDRKWLPDTNYGNFYKFLGNRVFLQFYFSIHKYLNHARIRNASKDEYSFMKYSTNVKSGKIQDSIGDIVVREAATLLKGCDHFLSRIFNDENLIISDEQVIEVISLLQWRFDLHQLLTTNVHKLKPEELKEALSNLHVHYKWFIKNSINKVTSLLNTRIDEEISKTISIINSELTTCFDGLKKMGNRIRKKSVKPPPLINEAQLTVFPEYHKMLDIISLSKNENIGKILSKLSNENFVLDLINLKVEINYEMKETPEKYVQVKEFFEKFLDQTGNDQYRKSDVDYLLISNYLSLISVCQTRSNISETIIPDVSVPPVLQGVLKRFEITKDERLIHEITSYITQFLLQNPSVTPCKYLKYKSDDGNISEAGLSLHNPILTYLFSSILLNSDSKTFSLQVNLKDYHNAMELYNKFSRLLWKNTYQLSDVKCDFIYLEKEYITRKVTTFIQNLSTSFKVYDVAKNLPEILELCIEQIKIVQTNLKDEKEFWCVFLPESYKQTQKSHTSLTSNINSIANCYIITSYLTALLNSKLPLIDPYTKAILKKKHVAKQAENFEILNSSFEIQGEIYSNVEFPLCPIITEKIGDLHNTESELSKEIAVRPQVPKYGSLLQDVNSAFLTILSPNKIRILYEDLEAAIISLEYHNSTIPNADNINNNLNRATTHVTSIENFINALNQYRYVYPDIIELLYCNVMELIYGLKMKISLLKKLMLRHKYSLSNVQIQNRLTNLIKYPNLHENQSNIDEVTGNYMNSDMQNFVGTLLSEEDSYVVKQQKLSLLKCAIQETFNVCTTNAKYSRTSNTRLFVKFNGFIKHFITIWNKQEEESAKKQIESESLYKIKTKASDKSEDEQIEDEFKNLFPTYFGEFSDIGQQELKSDADENPEEEEFSAITLEDINFVYKLHAAFLYSHSKSPWLNLNEKHDHLDHINPLIRKYKLLKLLLNDCIAALNYDMDPNVLGSLHVLISVAQKYGSPNDENNSPTHSTKKSSNFYREPSISEVKPCLQILQDLRTTIQEFLVEWPEHPTLQDIVTVIGRISSFDIASPLSRFLTGFEVLLTKCHEWEDNAHRGVSVQNHILNITAQIIIWRKSELNMWRDILNFTFNRMNDAIGKWWCYIYLIIEQFRENAITITDLIATLEMFITKSNLAEFENKLELLFLFHCHCLHTEQSGQLQTLMNVLWNLYHYYKQFLPVIIAKIRELRTPIEKKLKDYVKIVTWKDVSYWSVKETLHKTHKTIHKHVREYEKALNLAVHRFLNDSGEQNSIHENVGIWDRPQRVSPKSYHYTMDSLTYIAKKSLSKKSDLSIKTEKYFKKSRVLCKDIISTTQYPKLVKSVDILVGEIIETCNHLEKLEVNTSLPKDKQKAQAKNILQRKHRSLADLFKLLLKMGVSFKKGMMERQLNSPETRFITEPIDLEALFDHLNYKRNDEKVLTMWDGCELYSLRSLLRLDVLEKALRNPSKGLGLQNIERCRGFANDLVELIYQQKQKLIKTSEAFYYFRYYLAYFTDICNETHFIHKTTYDELQNTLSNVITVVEQYKIVLYTCPDDTYDETGLKSIPTLKPDKTNVPYSKHDPIWNRAITVLNNITMSAERILNNLKKNKNIIPSTRCDFVSPTYIPISDFDGITKELDSISAKLSDLLDLVGDIPLYDSLNWSLKEIHGLKNKLLDQESREDDYEKSIRNITKSSEILLQKSLISFQNLYKKYKSLEPEVEAVQDITLEESDSDIKQQHLKELIMENLFEDLSCLNTADMLKYMKIITKNINKLTPNHYPNIANILYSNLVLYEQLILLFEYFITQQVSAYRVTSKLTSVLLNIFIELAGKGFCIPPEFSDEISNEGESHQSGGMGLGDGEGEKDVSDRIETEDQLDDAKQEGQKQKNEEDKDCKEEENAIEMSEDFDSKLQDVGKDADNENEDSQSDGEEQMGDTEKGADNVDEQIWGSDDEEEEKEADDNNDMKEEKGDSGEKEGEQQMGAKENQSGENEDTPDSQEESKDKKSANQINEEDPEYDADQVDPYHGNQPELPEPEPMDLPDNLELDDNEKETNDDNQDENPFDIDTMKEQMPPEKEDEKKEEENSEANRDEKDNADEEDDTKSENGDHQEPMETDKDNIENPKDSTPEDEVNRDTQEDVKQSEQSVLDQKDTNENQVQPMDVDSKINESADKVHANEAKNQISHENDPISQEDAPDKEGVGQSQMEDSSTGHKGAANAQQDTQDSKRDEAEEPEKRQKPGKSDSKRSLGDTSESVKKKLKTIEMNDDQEVEDEKMEDAQAEKYQHITEATQHSDQVLDVATQEQVEQQKEIPDAKDEETEKPTESSEEIPEEQDESPKVENEIKQRAEKVEGEKDTTDKSQHPDGDIINEADKMEVEVEGEIIQTSTVPRGNESTHHTQFSNLTSEVTRLNAEDMNSIRVQIEEQLAKWTETPPSEEAQKTWEKISSFTSPLAQDLSEQLRLVLEPTQASRMRGDFKTGKRINMRKIIPYIASQFRKDKIWLRRTKPAKRDYQIVLAIDDSSSMDDNHSKELAFESVAMISKALTLLESGQLSILSFGESTELLHKLDEQFTDKSGYKLLQKFQFDQKKTCVGQMVNFATEMLNNSHGQSNALNAKLLVVVSDGRGIFSEGETYIQQAIRRATLANIFMVFIIIDNPVNNSSILDIRTPVFNRNTTEILSIKSYMDCFPFPFYIILRDINSLPNVLSDALRQWFEIVSNTDRA